MRYGAIYDPWGFFYMVPVGIGRVAGKGETMQLNEHEGSYQTLLV